MAAIARLANRILYGGGSRSSSKPRPVQSRAFIHDRSQLELILTYPVLPKHDDRKYGKRERVNFEVDIYFAFPPQLQISPRTYPKDKLYQDLVCYTRLREPRLSPKRMLHPAADDKPSPLQSLEEHIAKLSQTPDSKRLENAVAEARLFGCSYANYFFRRTARKQDRLSSLLYKAQKTTKIKTLQRIETAMDGTVEVLLRAQQVLTLLRSMIERCDLNKAPQLTRLHEELRAIDEYGTYRFLDGLMSISKTITDSPLMENHADSRVFAKKLIALYRLERWYARKQGYHWPDLNSSRKERERYLNRKRTLKRRLWSVLYLDQKRKPFRSLTNSIGAMTAAALAAFWALAANVFILRFIGVENLEGSVTSLLGFNGFIAITAVVLAYVLKDRIKDFGKANFGDHLFRNAPDYVNHLTYSRPNKRQLPVGRLSEQTEYLPASTLPDQILAALIHETKDVACAYDTGRQVLHYRKKVSLSPYSLSKATSGAKAVNDILRFNVERFLPRLDDPEEQALTMTRQGDINTIILPKVYYLDIIVACGSLHADTNQPPPLCMDYVRLVMTKSGLTRIDYL